MRSDDVVFLASSPSVSIPSRNLGVQQAWYLIGSTPYDDDFPYTESMRVEKALVSLEVTPDGQRGYNQVVSPGVGYQETWVYTAGQDGARRMQVGKAYWVFMENKDTLAGFIATPLPLELSSYWR
jgi:hypothetical protein